MGNAATGCVFGNVDWKQQKAAQAEAGECLFGEVDAWKVYHIPVEILPDLEEIRQKEILAAQAKADQERNALKESVSAMNQKLAAVEQLTKTLEEEERKKKAELTTRINQVEQTAKSAGEGVKKVEEVLEAAKQRSSAKKAAKKKKADGQEGGEAAAEGEEAAGGDDAGD